MDRTPTADPHAVLEAWLSGTWERADGQTVLGQVWDPDTAYRYNTWIRNWLAFVPDPWMFSAVHVADWASRLHTTEKDERGAYRPLGQSGRARAVSAVRSFYRHCEECLDADAWNLPQRWKLAGKVTPAEVGKIGAEQMHALRDAAAAYRGPHAERARLAVDLLLAGLRPGQVIGLWLDHVRTVTADGPVWRPPAKNSTASAVSAWAPMPAPVVWALSLYLPVRSWRAPHSGPETGPVLLSTARENSPRAARGGLPLDRSVFAPIVRAVAATHPDLEDIAPALRMDHIAHSPSPFG